MDGVNVDPGDAVSSALGAGAPRFAFRLGLALAAALVGGGIARSARAEELARLQESLEREGSLTAFVLISATLPSTAEPAIREAAFRAAREGLEASLPQEDCRVRYRYRFSPVLLLELSSVAALRTVAALPGVLSIDPDREGSGGLGQSLELIRANQVHDEGVTGKGCTVAVLDTGVDTNHPDLEAAIVYQHHFLKAGLDDGPGAEDGYGHGTNVTGIILSRGIVTHVGMAPDAKLVAIKVLDDSNRGYLSDWAMGVEHAISLHEAPDGIRIDAINMSLVSDAVYPSSCDASNAAFSAACAAARQMGIAVFASSGNTGASNAMTSPACFSSVISVGAVYDTLPNRMASFTSRTDGLSLLAPGTTITSTGIGGGTSTYSGTSQACPHAVGLACLLREAVSSVSPESILSIQRLTGVLVEDPLVARSFPRIDALAAVDWLRGGSGDCDSNSTLDYLDIQAGAPDCDGNGSLDTCEIADGSQQDCNGNIIPDVCDLASGVLHDLDGDGAPDECFARSDFRRGDPNEDGNIDLSDAVYVLLYLFLGEVTPGCLESADSNNDGAIDLTDAVIVLSYLFTGGPPPALPGPPPGACGSDIDPPGSARDLGCHRYAACQ